MFLKILQYNISSLVAHSRRIELLKILQENNCSFAFIQETHLASRHRVYLDNFNILRNDSKQGVALLIKKNIKYELVDCCPSVFPSIFISFSCNMNNIFKKILIGSVYFPSNVSTSLLTSELIIWRAWPTDLMGLLLVGISTPEALPGEITHITSTAELWRPGSTSLIRLYQTFVLTRLLFQEAHPFLTTS